MPYQAHSLHLFTLRIQIFQPLSAIAINARDTFENAMLHKLDAEKIDVEKIWFSSDAFYSLDCFVIKQNWHNSGIEHDHVSVPSSLNPQNNWFRLPLLANHSLGHFSRRQMINAMLCVDSLREIVAIQNALASHVNTSFSVQVRTRPHQTSEVFHFFMKYFNDCVLYNWKNTGRDMD